MRTRSLAQNMESLFAVAIVLGLVVLAANFSTVDADLVRVLLILLALCTLLLMLIFRARRRRIRQETIRETRNMLRDLVNNQLTVISMNASAFNAMLVDPKESVDRITDSVNHISELLESLSEESLRNWENSYQKTFSDLQTYMDK